MSGALAGNILGMVLGQGMGPINDDRQVNLQGRLGQQQTAQYRNMLGIQAEKELKMWKDTSYPAQVEMMKKAGINPALMYGMGGGGGQSMGGGAPTGTGGVAAGGGGQETAQYMGMGIQGAQLGAQLSLLKAQKENIEADTEKKKSEVPVNVAKEQEIGQNNAIRALLIGTDPEGKDVGTGEESAGAKSMAFQKEAQEYRQRGAETRYKIDENDRQKLMNSKVMEEIGAKISLMHKQGMSQEEIYKNLQKEGKILDAEIEWNALDIEQDNVGKFIWNAIKMLFKPR